MGDELSLDGRLPTVEESGEVVSPCSDRHVVLLLGQGVGVPGGLEFKTGSEGDTEVVGKLALSSLEVDRRRDKVSLMDLIALLILVISTRTKLQPEQS